MLEGKAMRKEDDVEEKPTQAVTSERAARKAPKIVETDEELGDTELLGEATLAKMAPKKEEAPAAPAADEVKTEEKPASAE